MDKRIKYSFEQKLSAVRSVIWGRESLTSAARKIGGNDRSIQRRANVDQQHGKNGLVRRNGSYDGEFKVRVIKYMLKNQLSLLQATALFGLTHDNSIGRWLKIYERLGALAFLTENRGRKRSIMAKKTRKTKKVASNPVDERLTALQEENDYLRAEIAFLKKLDALIQQEKAAQTQARQQKPSRN